MEFLFGPVPSRRLGLSLGINIVPHKMCTYNCIYCEVGRTTDLTVERKGFYDPETIKREFVENIEKVGKIDYVTFSGSGEPTLNKDIGELVRFVKGKGYKVCVLTNGSLLYLDEVKDDLMEADVVIPSLDSVKRESFLKVNRPHHSLKLERIIEGIRDFTKEFKGKVWLEILFVKDVNDSDEDVKALVEATREINPFKVQIGTVDRPPADDWVEKLSDEEIMDIYTYMSAHLDVEVDLIGGFNKENDKFYEDVERSIVKLINIRPCTEDDLKRIFSLNEASLREKLDKLFEKGQAFEYYFGGKRFVVGNRSMMKKKMV